MILKVSKPIFLIATFFLLSCPSYSQVIIVPKAPTAPIIDAIADDDIWQVAEWHAVDHLWIDEVSGTENTMPTPHDTEMRFKIAWRDSLLFILAEVNDNALNGLVAGTVLEPGGIFQTDNVEVFIDEDHSGGIHTKTHNAFAYHVSTSGDVGDQCGCGDPDDLNGSSGDWNGRFYNENIASKWIQTGLTSYVWELAVTIYDDQFDEDIADNSASVVNLVVGKVMGFSIAYNDSDGLFMREHMIGSNEIPGTSNIERNIAWQQADVFGDVILDTIPEDFYTKVDLSIQQIFISDTSNLMVGDVITLDSIWITNNSPVSTLGDSITVHVSKDGLYVDDTTIYINQLDSGEGEMIVWGLSTCLCDTTSSLIIEMGENQTIDEYNYTNNVFVIDLEGGEGMDSKIDLTIPYVKYTKLDDTLSIQEVTIYNIGQCPTYMVDDSISIDYGGVRFMIALMDDTSVGSLDSVVIELNYDLAINSSSDMVIVSVDPLQYIDESDETNNGYLLTNNGPTGVELYDDDEWLKVYPIPAHHAFSIDYIGSQVGEGIIEVYDFNAQLIYDTKVLVYREEVVNVNLPFINEGVYWLVLKIGSSIQRGKLVIIH